MHAFHFTRRLCCFLLTLALAGPGLAQTTRMTVRADDPGKPVSPMLYGIFFEEINRAGDGGLYAEMVQNRSFEDGDEPVAWELEKGDGADATMTIDRAKPLNDRNPRALKVEVKQPGASGVRLVNRGFTNMAAKGGAGYVLTLYARGESAGPMKVRLVADEGGRTLAEGTVQGVTAEWKKLECSLKATDTEAKAKLVIELSAPGTVWLDMVSLFPAETWKNSGLRTDLAEMLVAMKPAFVRFPGGCWVEGETIANAYRWKDTIGPVERRRNQYNLWKYQSTHGLGHHEYLQLSENLGAEPLFVVNCGMAHKDNVPLDQMGEWVQDALDAIEYANGSTDTKWGAERAKNGHEKPFNMKYIEIGNENGGRAYDQRYALFYDAIKAKHPEMHIIAGEWQGRPRSRPIPILDEHYYNNPGFFVSNAERYDRYDRKGPKIYVGEYAVTRGSGTGNLIGAVAEAAFMTGLERNCDVVTMASYAPLFANVHYKAWNPDAIYFDASRAYGTPSYYVQKLFAEHRPDTVVPVETSVKSEPEAHSGAVGVGTWATRAEFRDIKVTHGQETLFASDFTDGLKGWRSTDGQWRVNGSGANATLRQTGEAEGSFAVAGDRGWGEYTLSLKARKQRGGEGFLIVFHHRDDNNYTMWNLGGWGNTRHGIERSSAGAKTLVGEGVSGKIETNRWYDVRVEVSRTHVKCYLDDKLVHDEPYPASKSLYATAGRKGNELILKVANVTDKPQATSIEIAGAAGERLGMPGRAVVLTSASPDDENSLDQPNKIVPVESELKLEGGKLSREFPPYSVTIIRVPASATAAR